MPSLANTLRSWVLMVCGGYAQLAGGIPVGRPVGDQFEDAQFRFRQAVPPGVRSLADDAAVYAKRIQVPSNAERVSGGAMGGIHVERDFQLLCGVVAVCSLAIASPESSGAPASRGAPTRPESALTRRVHRGRLRAVRNGGKQRALPTIALEQFHRGQDALTKSGIA